MKSLVVYSSVTGNTRKLAEAAWDTLNGPKEIFPILEAPEPEGYDLIAVGFWLIAGKPDPKSAEYLAKIPAGQSLFLFATHGAACGSEHAENAMNHAKEIASKTKIVGTFSCQGEVSPTILKKAGSKPVPPVWLKDAPAAEGHPDSADIEALKKVVEGLQ
ncbi:MAG: flavodoxin family protein [Desulfococcaceae bacterium]|jgi:flavodoxin|nr:flavodoxin family protein [Desulfococcaceae bacterium]